MKKLLLLLSSILISFNSFASISLWDYGTGLGTKAHWDFGTGLGTKAHWDFGTGLGSKAHWDFGTGQWSKEHWDYGTGPGSKEHWDYGTGLGSKSQWDYGSGMGSKSQWDFGSGMGSKLQWNYGSGKTFNNNPAVEEALTLKESGAASETTADSIGTLKTVDTFRTALAMGVDRAIFIKTETDFLILCLGLISSREKSRIPEFCNIYPNLLDIF